MIHRPGHNDLDLGGHIGYKMGIGKPEYQYSQHKNPFLAVRNIFILLFSASTYAIPLFQVDLAHSLSGEAHHVRYIDFTKTRSEAGDGSVRISPFFIKPAWQRECHVDGQFQFKSV